MIHLSAKIIRILSPSQILVNAGKTSNENLVEGAYGKILGHDENIVDPESQEVLGTVTITKGSVIISRIYDRFSLCKITQIITAHKKLPLSQNQVRVKVSDISPWQSSTEPISVGDLVVFDIPELNENDVTKPDDVPF